MISVESWDDHWKNVKFYVCTYCGCEILMVVTCLEGNELLVFGVLNNSCLCF
jgi:hypothetical protein